MNHDVIRDSLAAYAVGTLPTAERADVDGHLAACADCQETLADFTPLAALMARSTAADIESAAAPVPDLAARALAAHRARRRRRTTWVSVAAAAVIAAGGGTAVLLTRPDAPPARVEVQATDATSHVTAKVSYLASNEGTNLWLKLEGVASGEHCELIAIGPGGKREVAATWQASYAGEAKVQGMTAFAAKALRGFEIATTDGRHLVWVDAES